jgi:hypothetical protein
MKAMQTFELTITWAFNRDSICPLKEFRGRLTIQEIQGIQEKHKAILNRPVELLICYHNLLFVYQVAC